MENFTRQKTHVSGIQIVFLSPYHLRIAVLDVDNDLAILIIRICYFSEYTQ